MIEWISVKDKLPEYYKEVLLYPRMCAGWREQIIGDPPWTYVSNYSRQSFNLNVTHWMPLPDMPKESNGETARPRAWK